MNAAQLNGMRKLWEAASGINETKTAREMALTSHDLGSHGMTAVTSDGKVWVWDSHSNHWVR
jgi:hypothetical protein